MSTRRTVSAAVLAAGCLLTACVAGVPYVTVSEPSALPGVSPVLHPLRCVSPSPGEGAGAATLHERFGVELLAATSAGGTRNALVSPLSVGTALAMLAEGTAEPERRSIWTLLRTGGTPGGAAGSGTAGPPQQQDAGGEGLRALLLCRLAAIAAAADTDEDVELRVANAAFPSRSLDFAGYGAALERHFGAHVEALDFLDPGAVRRINAWAARATDGAIEDLLASLPHDTLQVLANAVLFRGEWTEAFDPARTVPRPFRTGAGRGVEVATMQADGLVARYREDGHFQALSLPYGRGSFALVLVLPRPGITAADALRRLASDASWLGGRGFQRARGHLSLPRMSVEGRYELLDTLRALGLGNEVPLSQVVHRTLLELDEAGTEAVAATAAVTTKSLVLAAPTFDMRIERPFALALRHLDTGAFLFAAWIEDPSS